MKKFILIISFIASIITIITFLFNDKNTNVVPPETVSQQYSTSSSGTTNNGTRTSNTYSSSSSTSTPATNTSSSNKIVLDSYGPITVYTEKLPRGGTTLYVHNSSSTCYNVQLDYFLQGAGYTGWFNDPGSAYVCGGGSDYKYAYSSEGITDAKIAKLTKANY